MTLKFRLSMDEVALGPYLTLTYKNGSPIPVGCELNLKRADGTEWGYGPDDIGKVSLQATTDPAYPTCLVADMNAVSSADRFELIVYPQNVGIIDEIYVDVLLKVDPSYHFDPSNEPWHELLDLVTEYRGDTDFLYVPLWSEAWETQQLTLTGRMSLAAGGNSNLWQKSNAGQIPIGQWFHLRYHIVRHATNGQVQIWINDTLVLSVTGIKTKIVDQFHSEILKLYGGPIPKLIYCKGFEIHDSMPNGAAPPPSQATNAGILLALILLLLIIGAVTLK